MILGQAWGSLHVAEKADGDFIEADERATLALAQEAANAINLQRRVGAGVRAS